MTEEQANREPAQPPEAAPSQETGGKAHASAQPAMRASLGEWRAPAFWMSCGALLAAMVGGAVVLAQRVSVERDMMAVAATLPLASAAPTAPPETAPNARPLQPAPPAMQAEHRRSVRVPPPAPAPHAASRARHPRQAHAAPRKARVRSYAKAANVREQYPEVFKRCPQLGTQGALECRRHICNGAESGGPACKPYRPKQR